jgi:hypothetical protein
LGSKEEEQRRRAAELREQVERLKSGEEAPEEEAEPVPESPREFIRRKMREEEEEGEGEPEPEEPAGED